MKCNFALLRDDPVTKHPNYRCEACGIIVEIRAPDVQSALDKMPECGELKKRIPKFPLTSSAAAFRSVFDCPTNPACTERPDGCWLAKDYGCAKDMRAALDEFKKNGVCPIA